MNFERIMYIVSYVAGATPGCLPGWPMDTTPEENDVVRTMCIRFENRMIIPEGGTYTDDCRAITGMGSRAAPHIVAYLMTEGV